ncbi:MAG: hypothetical protein KGZ49_07915 [Syntrophaceae bacterium]|nr:hypothetical protein [Syntrophaceae bacterium]
MKRIRKNMILFLVISLITGGIFSEGWSQDRSTKDNPPINEGKAFLDILVARPIGFVVGMLGVSIFISSLPFTIPTRSVDDAANFLIVKPFTFSFYRKFPDESMM